MRRLRIGFLLSFLALSVPFGILLNRSYRNLDQESFFFYRRTAESVVSSVSRQLEEWLRVEEERSYTEYRYLHVPERSLPGQLGLNLSPLSSYPVESEIPGIVGYFQIDPDGTFRSPLLPDPGQEAELSVPRLEERRALQEELREIVQQAGLPALARTGTTELDAATAEPKPSLEEEIRLLSNLASRSDLTLQQRYAKEAPAPAELGAQSKRKSEEATQQRRLEPTSERQALVFDDQLGGTYRERENREGSAGPGRAGADRSPSGELRDESARRQETESFDEESSLRVAAEVDPFQAHLVAGRWIILERKVWWHDRRYVQGLVARLEDVGDVLIDPQLRSSALPEDAGFLLFHEGELVLASAYDPGAAKPLLLENTRLPSPFAGFHLALTIMDLPPGPGRNLVNLMAVIAALLIPGGVWSVYRLTATQWRISRKQSDFVAAISHELKSPLTSIRMYGEMLMEGWVDGEEKKQSYYRHIHDESERLTRLIQNVLRLAQLERGRWDVRLREEDPATVVPELVRQLQKPLRRAGFQIHCEIDGKPRPIRVDRDALTQILINLTDNAVKFASGFEPRRILVRLVEVKGATEVRVRDFGPGIPRGERKRIFQQFYRVGSEMTRTAQGTGLGLALVRMLMQAMGGRVEVTDGRPGAEFRLIFPAVS